MITAGTKSYRIIESSVAPRQTNGISPQLAPMSFDLIDIDGQRQPWTNAGPKNGNEEAVVLLGGGSGMAGRHNAAVVREDGREAYYLSSSGSTLNWLPQGVDGPKQKVEMAAEFPPLSWGSAMSWDTRKGVLTIVSIGSEGVFYRYDTHQHRWLSNKSLKGRDLTGLAYDSANGRYFAVSESAELLVLNESGELIELRPLANALEKLPEAIGGRPVNLAGLSVAVMGDLAAVIRVREGKVTHIWTYNLVSRQVQLTYERVRLASPAEAASMPAHPAIPASSGPSLKERAKALMAQVAQIYELRAAPSNWLQIVSIGTEAWLYLSGLIAIPVLFALLVWQVARPAHTVRSSVFRLLAAVLILAMPWLLIDAGKPQNQLLFFTPVELWWIFKMQLYALKFNTALDKFMGQGTDYRLMATSFFWMTVLAIAILLPGTRKAAVQRLGLALTVLLAAAPVMDLAKRYQHAHDLALETAAGEAAFKAKCQQAGSKRMYAIAEIDGIRLHGLRGDANDTAYTDKDWPDAGIPDDRNGVNYITSFLDTEFQDDRANPAWSVPGLPGRVTMLGYRFVDVQEADGSYLRYSLASGSATDGFSIERIPGEQAARYLVTYTREDTPQDRMRWIAGASVVVSDTLTGERMGELHIASHAPPLRQALGELQQRSWRSATSCPTFDNAVKGLMIRTFAEEIVRRPQR